ncbi:MAG: tRNA (adenosine(37)-N6)-threonylcarbamoyltransferase complex ATPase subunit type 1 TsaE [Dehalococcoidales bacterium]
MPPDDISPPAGSKKKGQLDLTSRHPQDTQRLGARLGELAKAGDVYLLVGNLGAGKTCLTQGIARGLGIKEYALSPSFVIVRELYGRLPLYHMDLYRLDDTAEIDELGLDEYIYGNGVCVVEWAEKGLALLPPEHLLVQIDYREDTGRHLKLTAIGRRYRELIAALGKGGADAAGH